MKIGDENAGSWLYIICGGCINNGKSEVFMDHYFNKLSGGREHVYNIYLNYSAIYEYVNAEQKVWARSLLQGTCIMSK